MTKLQPTVVQECVRVVVRCRPLSEKEIREGHECIVHMSTKQGSVSLANPKTQEEASKQFTYDAVYDQNSKQIELYDETFRELVDSVVDGYNGTIFAYGQTGTGKTFTMEGVRGNTDSQGVIPNSFAHIFGRIARSSNMQFLVRASYLEIYQEEIRDLLQSDHSQRLELKERPDVGVYVKDLSSFVTKNSAEIENVMNVGNKHRSTGATNMNEHSSRSHAIFVITVECSEVGQTGKQQIRVGKLNLVDLAGSERQSKTGATGQRFKEATKINLSLSALGNVISSLVDGHSTHVPYRDSKLTRLLQDSLGGNAKTVMVANVGPASYNYEETLSTLRYADRAKRIKNKPKINEDPKDTLLREFQEELLRLKSQLDAKGGPKKRRRRRRGGEEVEVDAEEAAPESFEEASAKLEAERQALMANSTMLTEEKEKLLKALEVRANALQQATTVQRAMEAKIQAMESKLLSGGGEGALYVQASAQQAELEVQRQQLVEQKRQERELVQSLEAQEEQTAEVIQTYSTLQQEAHLKSKKLKKLWNRLQQVQSECVDAVADHSTQRIELEETISQLTRETKLASLMLANFVPLEFRQRLEARAYFDTEEDTWKLRTADAEVSTEGDAQKVQTGPGLEQPIATPGARRPVTQYARLQAQLGGGVAIHLKDENVMLLDLDVPTRTTHEYSSPNVDAGLKAALNDALDEDTLVGHPGKSEVVIDTRNRMLISRAGGRPSENKKSKNLHRPTALAHQSPKTKRQTPPAQNFPQARGLVSAAGRR